VKYERLEGIFGAADGKTGLDEEVKEAREVFGPIKERAWLPWAEELMVEFAKEVEAERKAEEEERRRMAAEDEQRRREQEEERRREELRERAEAEERRKEEIRKKYEMDMEELVDAVGEGKITTEEFERREKEIEGEKARELGEEEKKDEEKVGEKVREKVVVEIPEMGGKRGRGRPKKKAVEGAETDAEGNIGDIIYIVDKEKMVSKIFSLFYYF
jgi:hypothetical protein